MKSFIGRYAGFVLLFGGVIGIIILNLSSLKPAAQILPPVTTAAPGERKQTLTTSTRGTQVYVDIKGEVRYPGVYLLDPGSRIADLIQAAGGLLADADTENLNLARVLSDEMVIIIPSRMQAVALPSPTASPVLVVVDIKGEVRYPGIYELPLGARVGEAITKAGGLTVHADITTFNRAEAVKDGMQITVPRLPTVAPLIKERIYVEIQGEVVKPGLYEVDSDWVLKQLVNLAGGLQIGADITGLNLNKPLVAGERIVIRKYEAQPAVVETENQPQTETIPDGLIDINTADLDDLMTLKGIGIVLGQRIIDYRAEYGPFAAIEDIMLVSGIKESIFANIRDAIKVGNR
mgnify:CR=1 FL=1